MTRDSTKSLGSPEHDHGNCENPASSSRRWDSPRMARFPARHKKPASPAALRAMSLRACYTVVRRINHCKPKAEGSCFWPEVLASRPRQPLSCKPSQAMRTSDSCRVTHASHKHCEDRRLRRPSRVTWFASLLVLVSLCVGITPSNTASAQSNVPHRTSDWGGSRGNTVKPDKVSPDLRRRIVRARQEPRRRTVKTASKSSCKLTVR